MRKHHIQQKLPYLVIGAIGVVYGDIGTSPLYALKSCFTMGGLLVNELNILGLISLFIWSLILIVCLKYVRFVLKMDHQGEGGILALSTLVASHTNFHPRLILILGMIGASLFLGDGVITPAISVLSAVEGIIVISPQLSNYIIPITLLILTGLFAVQRFGSSRIGRYFGPVMVVWFLTLFILGVLNIYKYPLILKSINPYYAISFLLSHSWTGLIVMGGVVLVITGAEALYADLGHFGKRPIQLSWTYFVFPSLIFNYLGQGALLLLSPGSISNPFYLMAPEWALHALIILSTIATVIASQSVLSGIFSMTYHSILLNYFPRLKVDHTSEDFSGQIYISFINIFIYILTISAVLIFRSSDNLSVSYGLCVAGIMIITTTLAFLLAYKHYKWGLLKLICIFLPLFFVDLLFVSTNIIKFFEGAWYVVLISSIIYYCMYVWRKGDQARQKQQINVSASIETYIKKHSKEHASYIPGTALFLCQEPFKVPSTLAINLQHNKLLHEKIILVAIQNVKTPYYHNSERFESFPLLDNTFQVVGKFGFMEKPSIHKLLHWLKKQNIIDGEDNISLFLGKYIPVKTKSPYLSKLSENLYVFLVSLNQNAIDFYQMPHHKVIELGVRYKI